MDKVCKVTVLREDFSEVVDFLLKVVLCVDDPSGPVVETSHHISFRMGWMMGLKVVILVHVRGLSVDRKVQAGIPGVPSCWTAVVKRQGGRSNPHRPLTLNDEYPQ